MKNLLLSLAAIAALSAVAAPALAQDAQEGQKKAAMCIGCHGIEGYKASFPEIHSVPMISGQNAKYIVAALVAYQKGERKHPTMKGISASLSEKDMADLAAFYEGQGAKKAAPEQVKAPNEKVAALLQRANCASCHGDNFSKPIDAGYPKIAGQHADYLYAALKAYQTDKNPQIGRGNAIMAGMAKQYTPAELKLMSQYIGSLPGELSVVPQGRFR
jgi:cytochrome c553